MTQKQTFIIFLVLLIISLNESAYSQVTSRKYDKKKLPDSRIVIAPITIDSVDASFISKFNNVKAHKDTLKKIIDRYLQSSMRKYSEYKQLYCSDYLEQPNLKSRELNLSGNKSFEIFLPVDSENVKMILKGAKPQEPDIILFIEIGCIQYQLIPGYSGWISPGLHTYREPVDKIILENVRFAFWNNKEGEIVSYNQKDVESPIIDNNAFSPESKYLDILARYVLTRTPFSKTTMPFYF